MLLCRKEELLQSTDFWRNEQGGNAKLSDINLHAVLAAIDKDKQAGDVYVMKNNSSII